MAAKILVADDDPRNLFAVEEMLRASGLEIVLAESGEEVLRHVLKDDFAVILLDVQMPRHRRLRGRRDDPDAAALVAHPDHLPDRLQQGRPARLPRLLGGRRRLRLQADRALILKSKVDVFVDLYRKTEEIRRQGAEERRLLVENLQVRSEKLETEQELRRALERQEAILRSLPVVVTSRGVHPPFPALFVSDNVERLTGFPASRFTADAEFGAARIHPEDRDRVEAELMAAEEAGSYACEYRWRCADEEYRFFLDQGVLSPHESGRSREIFGTMFDVTERASSSSACCTPRSSRPSAGSPAASRTTSTTC